MMFATLLSFLLASAEAAVISVDPSTTLSIGGITTLDRSKWFGGHWSPSQEWRYDRYNPHPCNHVHTNATMPCVLAHRRTQQSYTRFQHRRSHKHSFPPPPPLAFLPYSKRPQDLAEFGSGGYRTHPGRAFAVSSRMAQVKEDAGRPGHVDVASLLASCKSQSPDTLWPVGDLDFITSSKTQQLYANSCEGPGGARPKGFVPGSHAATAEFFALFYQHCMVPTTRSRYLMEVANECEVKIYPSRCNTTWPEMIGLHIAVADALHAAHQNSSAAGGAPPPAPLVCGPTAAFPEYQLSDFNRWRANGTMANFLTEAGGHVDCFSVHLYVNRKPLPTENLLGDTDGLLRPPLEGGILRGGRSKPPVSSRVRQPAAIAFC